jgi:hypothetical protein
LKLDLACGDRKEEGFIGIDKYKTDSTDMEFDLLEFPWPIEDGSVEQVRCSHFFEHIPARLRPRFMEELYRIMKPGATGLIIVPALTSERAYWDFTHEWPPVCGNSFLYFNEKWRVENKLTHGPYDIKCNFEFQAGALPSAEWQARARDAMMFAIKNYWNAATDTYVNFKKI